MQHYFLIPKFGSGAKSIESDKLISLQASPKSNEINYISFPLFLHLQILVCVIKQIWTKVGVQFVGA